MTKLLSCAIGLLLLTCGVVEAGDKAGCYKRMADSMRDAEQYQEMFFSSLFIIDGAESLLNQFDCGPGCTVIENSWSCDEICKLEKRLADAKARRKRHEDMSEAKKRWNSVMKECVQ